MSMLCYVPLQRVIMVTIHIITFLSWIISFNPKTVLWSRHFNHHFTKWKTKAPGAEVSWPRSQSWHRVESRLDLWSSGSGMYFQCWKKSKMAARREMHSTPKAIQNSKDDGIFYIALLDVLQAMNEPSLLSSTCKIQAGSSLFFPPSLSLFNSR